MSLNKGDRERIAAAVDGAFDAQVELTKRFVSIPSTRGAEWPAQDFMAGELRLRGYVVDDWQISMADLAGLPDLGVITHDFSRARTGCRNTQTCAGDGTVDYPAGTLRRRSCRTRRDVANASVLQPVIKGGWLHGRGAADMKGWNVGRALCDRGHPQRRIPPYGPGAFSVGHRGREHGRRRAFRAATRISCGLCVAAGADRGRALAMSVLV